MMSDRLKVGQRAVIEHLYNTTLMSEADRDGLIQRLGEAVP
jgi:hypothetical protein